MGYVSATCGGKYAIYSGYTKIGELRRSYSGGWDVYSGYTKVGSVRGGPAGPAGGAALLLLM